MPQPAATPGVCVRSQLRRLAEFANCRLLSLLRRQSMATSNSDVSRSASRTASPTSAASWPGPRAQRVKSSTYTLCWRRSSSALARRCQGRVSTLRKKTANGHPGSMPLDGAHGSPMALPTRTRRRV
eukprot:6857305-Pyramimonas_sp.AAC.1